MSPEVAAFGLVVCAAALLWRAIRCRHPSASWTVEHAENPASMWIRCAACGKEIDQLHSNWLRQMDDDIEDARAISRIIQSGGDAPRIGCAFCGKSTSLVFRDGSACCDAAGCLDQRAGQLRGRSTGSG